MLMILERVMRLKHIMMFWQTVHYQMVIDLIHLYLVYLSEDFKYEETQENLIKYLQSVFIKQVDNPKFNPYYEYSRMIEEEVNVMMSAADALEAMAEQRGEQRGERRGIVKVLLQFGKTDNEIIQYLTTDLNDPLTEDEAVEALESCREGNR